MRAEIEAISEEIKQSLDLLRRHLDPEATQKKLAALTARSEAPDFWNDQSAAQKIMRQRNLLEHRLQDFASFESEFTDNIELLEMAEAEEDEAMIAEAEAALGAVRERAGKAQLETLLSGEADANDAFLEVHAGAGGTESQDWAEMLARMYSRWAERRGFKIEWIQESPGEEAGIKSATMRITGANAYGWLKTESGVHRLVRISPFDSQSRRHTSFSSVWIYPVIDEDIEIEINDSDLRIDTYRASGAGGQHINKTDSAVRLTHLPTKIVVQCQSDRSQHRNKAEAMRMLKARLYERELQIREEEFQAEQATKTDIGWGHQIRSYVLHPYQLVKDLRTDVETGNTKNVLDGDIDDFLEAALAARIGKGEQRGKQKAG
ncbi:MAG: peptide chain release factor 2 [Alphaproteobacteria bacterium]